MTFQPFELERWMSRYEQEVEYNLTESGVHPILLRELLANEPELIYQLMETDLNYPYVNGMPELRSNIAAMYDGASADNVLVTVGAAEANYITTQTLLDPGDEIVIMMPNYMQIWGIARNHNLATKTFHLSEQNGWSPDLNELQSVVSPDTKLIAVCNPNNPTGSAMSSGEMDAIVTIAERVGAWILADEVYRGAERETDEETPSFYGRYPKVMAVGSMSKAYGMPGLRIGWCVGPSEILDDIWARHEYTTISATMLSNKLAALALSDQVRPRILQRTRRLIREGFSLFNHWLEQHRSLFSLSPPDAAAIAFVRYHLDINSTNLAQRLRQEKSVLVVPGDHFGMDRFLRISFGLPEDILLPALDRMQGLITELDR